MPPSTKKIRIFSFSWRDLAIFCALFGSAVLLCILLHMANSSEGFAYSIFILTVLLISRFTTGYLFGTLAAVLSVVGTNYIFTYPYWAVNFTLSGYPLTFLTMLVVSLDEDIKMYPGFFRTELQDPTDAVKYFTTDGRQGR